MVNLILVSSFCAVLAVSFSCPVLGFQMEWKVVFCDDRELPIRLSLGVYLQFSHCDLADVCFADKKNIFQMLVVFKSAPILKRVLKVKHDLLQLYVLKVRMIYVTGLLKASNSCCFRDTSSVL